MSPTFKIHNRLQVQRAAQRFRRSPCKPSPKEMLVTLAHLERASIHRQPPTISDRSTRCLWHQWPPRILPARQFFITDPPPAIHAGYLRAPGAGRERWTVIHGEGTPCVVPLPRSAPLSSKWLARITTRDDQPKNDGVNPDALFLAHPGPQPRTEAHSSPIDRITLPQPPGGRGVQIQPH